MNEWKNTEDLFDNLGILNYVRHICNDINDESVAKFTELYRAIYDEISPCDRHKYIDPADDKAMASVIVNLCDKYNEWKHYPMLYSNKCR